MAKHDLTGKPIAITGASSGIGRATALACARVGMPVALGARRLDRLEGVAEEIRGAGGKAIARATDVNDPASCRALIEATVSEFGSIYAVFANAGYGFEGAMHELDDGELRGIFETNFWGTINTCRPALEHFMKAGRGHVLICSSCIAKIGIPYYGPYCATKAAQNLIGRAMRHELAPLGVHVSTVHPVGTRTEFFDVSSQRTRGPSALDQGSGRFMQPPERVANAIVACLRRPKTEVWTSWTTRWAFGLMNAFPRIADVVLNIHAKKQRKRLADVEGEQATASES